MSTTTESSPTTLATSLHGAKDLRFENRSLPAPGPNELQIQIRATGLCGSDLHYYNHNRNGDIQVLEPLTLGHESAGIVLAAGSEVVSKFKTGDKVALEVGLACKNCERCKEGRYNICAGMRFGSSAKGGLPHTQGTLQGRVNHPAALCYKLGMDMSLELGALVEPLSVAIHASRRARIKEEPGLRGKVLVFGAGAVGLLCAAVCKLEGVKRVVIADVDAGRVKFATENGFAHEGFVVPMLRGSTTEENLGIARTIASEIGNLKGAAGEEVGEVDAVFECTGVNSCLQTAIYVSLSTHMFCAGLISNMSQGNTARRQNPTNRNGHTHPNPPHIRCRSARNRSCRRLPLRQRLPSSHRNALYHTQRGRARLLETSHASG